MQIVEPGGCGMHEEGQYYDIISASGSCTVRFRMADIGGRCVMHCHVLTHEDNGAMVWVDVQGGPAPDLTNIDPIICGGSCEPEVGVCNLINECGSTDGLDTCGHPCVAPSAGECGVGETCEANDCQPCAREVGVCNLINECGSTDGLDTCGNLCVAISEGECDASEICETNVCQPCAQVNEPCGNMSCCDGLSCSSGKPTSRVCYQSGLRLPGCSYLSSFLKDVF